MATRRQHIKLGIFTLAVALLLVLTLAFVGGQRWWQQRSTYYVISSETISGVDVESPVTLRGVKVGEVRDVQLDRSDFGRVRLELAVDEDVAIPAEAVAYFRRSGFTGQRAIDITGSTTAQGVLPPGSTIPRAATTLEELEERAEDFTAKAVVLLDRITALMEQAQDVASTIDVERVDALIRDTESFVGSMKTVGKQLEGAVKDGRKGVGSIVTRVDDVADGAQGVFDDVAEVANELRELLRHAKLVLRVNEDDLRASLGNIRRTTRNAEQLSRELRMRPSLLLRSQPPEERKLP